MTWYYYVYVDMFMDEGDVGCVSSIIKNTLRTKIDHNKAYH